MIDESSSMSDVIAGLKQADHDACYEFSRRQGPERFDALMAGAKRLGTIAFDLECRQPEALMAWKTPEQYEPVEALPACLDAACSGREDDIYEWLSGAPFATLAATASVSYYIHSAVARLRRYSH